MKTPRLLTLTLAASFALLAASCSDSSSSDQTADSTMSAEDSARAAVESQAPPQATEFYPQINEFINEAMKGFDDIPADRRERLNQLALYVNAKVSSGEDARMIFICTHNSRRSHLSQIWAAVAADHFGIKGVRAYSGGTEVTAFNPRAVAALERCGFRIEATSKGDNPWYSVNYGEGKPEIIAYSKKFDIDNNPQENFVAVMTCSQADKNCPTVKGAGLRVAIPYVDPKESDGTPQETATYDERNKQIATEMLYLFYTASMIQ